MDGFTSFLKNTERATSGSAGRRAPGEVRRACRRTGVEGRARKHKIIVPGKWATLLFTASGIMHRSGAGAARYMKASLE
jgi:hypothetical protein